MAAADLVNLSGLMDDAKCFAFVRQHRWPDGARGPGAAALRWSGTGATIGSGIDARHVRPASPISPVRGSPGTTSRCVCRYCASTLWAEQSTGDGAYDQETVTASIAERHPAAALIVPPRSNEVPSDTAATEPTQCDRHLQHGAEHGRMAWQTADGYTKRAKAETGLSRLKQVIGDGLRSHTDEQAMCSHGRAHDI